MRKREYTRFELKMCYGGISRIAGTISPISGHLRKTSRAPNSQCMLVEFARAPATQSALRFRIDWPLKMNALPLIWWQYISMNTGWQLFMESGRDLQILIWRFFVVVFVLLCFVLFSQSEELDIGVIQRQIMGLSPGRRHSFCRKTARTQALLTVDYYEIYIKESIKSPHYWLFCEGNPPGTFPWQRASNAERVSMSRRSHVTPCFLRIVECRYSAVQYDIILHTSL